MDPASFRTIQGHRQAHGAKPVIERRTTSRQAVSLPARIIWRDARGTTRFATVRTKDVSDCWASVECLSGTPIPLYRLVHLQIEQSRQLRDELPAGLRGGKVLSAVYRVSPSSSRTGVPEGYVLRLLNEPTRAAGHAAGSPSENQATATPARSIA